MWSRAEPIKVAQQLLFTAIFLDVAWISRLWDQDHSRRSDQREQICGIGLVHFIYRSKHFPLRTNVWGERDIKLFHKMSERDDKCFWEWGVLPFVISHRWDKLLSDLFIYTAWNNCIILGRNKKTQRRYENPLGCLWVTKESNNFPLHL